MSSATGPINITPTDEQRELLKGFTFAAPPTRKKTRKGLREAVLVLNTLAEQGVSEVSSCQLWQGLQRLGFGSMWSFEDHLGMLRTMSDVLSTLGATPIRKERDHGTWWKVEVITPEMLDQRGVSLG